MSKTKQTPKHTPGPWWCKVIQIERSGSTQDTYWATPIQPSYTLAQLAAEGEIIERPDLIRAVARSATRARVIRVVQIKSTTGQYAGTTGRFFAVVSPNAIAEAKP